jgi:hypothetical protein
MVHSRAGTNLLSLIIAFPIQALAIPIICFGCASSGPSDIPVTGVSVSPRTLSLFAGGETATLTAVVAPSNATNKKVTWSSDADNVAAVSDSGVVTSISAGSATITVTTTDGNKTAKCAVVVSSTSFPGFYTITYHTNGATGGSVPVDYLSYQHGDAATVLDNIGILEKANNIFIGWNTRTDGTGSSFDAGSTITIDSSNVELYAIWLSGTVYASGTDHNDNGYACYWKGRSETVLAASGSSANSIYISGGVVYTAGSDANGKACYWVGPDETVIPGGDEATSIFVFDGSVYTAGRSSYFGAGASWKGTTGQGLPYCAAANSIFVDNGIAYVAGQGDDPSKPYYYPCYWAGSTVVILAEYGGAQSIFVDQGVVYTAGGTNGYWIGTSFILVPDLSSAKRICAYDGTVYIAGKDNSGSGCYFSGTNKTTLPGRWSVNSIFVYKGKVFTAGQDNWNACYWVGTNKTILPVPGSGSGEASSIFVVPSS